MLTKNEVAEILNQYHSKIRALAEATGKNKRQTKASFDSAEKFFDDCQKALAKRLDNPNENQEILQLLHDNFEIRAKDFLLAHEKLLQADDEYKVFSDLFTKILADQMKMEKNLEFNIDLSQENLQELVEKYKFLDTLEQTKTSDCFGSVRKVPAAHADIPILRPDSLPTFLMETSDKFELLSSLTVSTQYTTSNDDSNVDDSSVSHSTVSPTY